MNATALAALALGLAAAPVFAVECAEKELSAGTALEDGTLAGEKETLAYLKDNEPSLHSRLGALKPEDMRKEFSGQFEWFQRPGRCRQRQKREMVRQMGDAFSVRDGAAAYTSAASDQKAVLREKIKKALADQFDSESAVMTVKLDGMRQDPKGFEKDIETLTRALAARKKDREAILSARLAEKLPY